MTPEPAMAPLPPSTSFSPAPAPAVCMNQPPAELPPAVAETFAQTHCELPAPVAEAAAMEPEPPVPSFESASAMELWSRLPLERPALPPPSDAPEPEKVALLPPPDPESYSADETTLALMHRLSGDKRLQQEFEPSDEQDFDDAVTLRRSRGLEFLAWLHQQLPSQPEQLPDDAFEPSRNSQRTARRLAAVLAAIAAVSLLPVVLSGHVNLLAAPPWALFAVLLAVIQLVYAAWLANAPDWASARVQMIVSAGLTTVYAMLLTLVVVTPTSRQLILGLDGVRRLAPAWCGMMSFVMAATTWYCGRTSTRWRQELAEDGD